MSAKIPHQHLVGADAPCYICNPQIKICKAADRVIIPSRHETLLKNIDYMEVQIGRLAKMARDLRAEILLLTTE